MSTYTGEKARQYDRLYAALAAGYFVALPIVLVARALEPGQMVFGSDVVLTFYYVRAAVADSLRCGRLPIWDPNAFCGFPLLASMQSAVFYPLTWLFAFLEPGTAWTCTVIVHMTLSGVFAYCWLRMGFSSSRWGAVAGATVYMLSGFLLTHTYAGHVSLIVAYPWLPAVMWRLERLLKGVSPKRVALFSLTFAVLIFAGYPMFVFFAGMLVLAKLLHHWFREKNAEPRRKKCIAALAALGIAFLLAAPQLLPTLELISQTQRASGNPYEFATSYSFPPENVMTFVAPTFFGDVREAPYWGRWLLWEVCGFVGVSTVVLSVVGLKTTTAERRLWGAVCLAGLLLALGRYAPFFRAFYALVPGASLFRAPGRYLLLSLLALLPLVTAGFDQLVREEGPKRHTSLTIGIWTLSASALLVLLLLVGTEPDEGDSILWRQILSAAEDVREGSVRHMRLDPGLRAATYRQAWRSLAWAATALFTVGGCLLAHGLGALRGRWCAAILAFLVPLELLSFGSRYLTGFDKRALAWPSGLANVLDQENKGCFRVASRGRPGGCEQTRDIGRCQVRGVQHVGGYDPLLLARYAELMNSVAGRPADEYLVVSEPDSPHPVLRMLGVRHWIVHDGVAPPARCQAVGSFDGIRIFGSPDAMPRAFLVHQARSIKDKEERLRCLASSAADLGKTVVVEVPTPDMAVGAGDGTGEVRIVSSWPGFYEIETESGAGSYLVLTEAYYPGWKAAINGQPVEILRANHLVQAVQLPPGEHKLTFEYSSRFLPLGFILAGLGTAGLCGHWLLARSRRPRG